MNARHDPIADPLTPEMRAKVERVFAKIPARPPLPTALTALERAALAGGGGFQPGIARMYGVSSYAVTDAYWRARAKVQRGAK
jgi:hypothetical protein